MTGTLKGIPVRYMAVGFRLPGAVRDSTGAVLLPAGKVLTAADLLGLGGRLLSGIFSAEDWPENIAEGSVVTSTAAPAPTRDSAPMAPPRAWSKREATSPAGAAQTGSAEGNERRISVDSLRVGMQLTCDIFDDQGVLSLAAGSCITERYLHLLRMRRVQFVHLQPGPRGPAPEPKGGVAAAQPARALAEPSRLSLQELWHEAHAGLEAHAGASHMLADVCAALRSGASPDGQQMQDLVGNFFDRLTLDYDLLTTIVSLQRSLGEYLFDHSINVALLSMTIGAQLGLEREQVHSIGVGAIFQDLGMLRIPETIRLAPRALTPDEYALVQRHPIYTLEYLEQMRGVPREACFISYQTHEREDRSGYPRNRSTTTIHPFAKIVAVADCFAAMIHSRPHRAPLIPHLAIKQLLQDGRQGRFDRNVIRALLDSVSAFPIGSEVELSNGMRAIVLRPNAGLHTRPVVALLDAKGAPGNTVIDLATDDEIQISRALHFHHHVPGSRILVNRS